MGKFPQAAALTPTQVPLHFTSPHCQLPTSGGGDGGGPVCNTSMLQPAQPCPFRAPKHSAVLQFFIIQESPLHKFYTALSMNYAK